MSWYRGSHDTTTSSVVSWAASAMNATVPTTLAWLSTTPRGWPVLPEVYWMKAVSSLRTAGKAGAPSSTSRSQGSTMCRTLAAADWDSSTSGRNQPIVATTVDSESRRMFAVASTPRVG